MLNMITSFKNQATENIFNGENTKIARKLCPQTLWKVACRKLDQLDSIQEIDELRVPPGNRFETLSGDRNGTFSIRINEQYRVCFKWKKSNPCDVEITDYH